MKLLTSIEEVDFFYDTGRKPLLVHCSDLNYYVTKYQVGNSSADYLLREYIAASFLKIWKLPVPDFSLIKLKKEHVPRSLGIHNINFDYPCFGSKYSRELKEVDYFTNQMSEYQSDKFQEKEKLLSIAFFDIWMANEDRNPNHSNLMIGIDQKGNYFVPIDHGECFNSGNIHMPLSPLTEEETLILSPLIPKLFTKSELGNQKSLSSLRQMWYLYSQSCKQNLQKILKEVPAEWLIQTEKIHESVNTHLLTDAWFEESHDTFLQHLQVITNRI